MIKQCVVCGAEFEARGRAKTCGRDYFVRKAAAIPLRKTKDGYTFKANAVPVSIEESRNRREAANKRSSIAYEEMKSRLRSTLVLDLTLPDGKLLRHATGAECNNAGGFYRAVGACLKPTQVVDKHMTEQNLRDIRARFYQRNKAAS